MAKSNLTLKQKKEKFLLLLGKNNGNITKTCKDMNIPRSLYYVWVKKYPDFLESVNDVCEQITDFVENKLLGLIDQNNTQAIIFYLKTKGKNRGYIEKNEIDMTGKIENVVIKPYEKPKE